MKHQRKNNRYELLLRNRFALLVALFPACFFYSLSYAQSPDETLEEASVLKSIDIEIESGLTADFLGTEKPSGQITVPTSSSDSQTNKNPAFIKIVGAPVSVVIEIESEELNAQDDQEEEIVSIRDFNIGQDGAGSTVTITPVAEENVISLGIGGTVEERRPLEGEYVGVNIVNINYL